VLLESAPDAMVIANEQCKAIPVHAQTDRSTAVIGYKREELLGQPGKPSSGNEQIIGNDRKEYTEEPRVPPMAAGRELFGLREDGTELPVEIGLSPFRTKELALQCGASPCRSRRRNGRQECMKGRPSYPRPMGRCQQRSIKRAAAVMKITQYCAI